MKLFEIYTMWEILFQHLIEIRDKVDPFLSHLQQIADAEMDVELEPECDMESDAEGCIAADDSEADSGEEDDSLCDTDDSIPRRYIAKHADEAEFLCSDSLQNALLDADAACIELMQPVSELLSALREPDDRLLEEFEIDNVTFEDYAEICHRAGDKLEELSECFSEILSVLVEIKIQVSSGSYDFYVRNYRPEGEIWLVDWFERLLELLEGTGNSFAEATDAVNDCIR